MESWSTEQTLSRWQSGDEGAFVKLHERFTPIVAIRISRNRSWHLLSKGYEVGDVVQEVWKRVLCTTREKFEPSFLGFLQAVTDNCIVDLLRRQGARKRGEGGSSNTLDTQAVSHAVPKPGLPEVETPTSRARASELQSIAREELNEREHLAWDLVEMKGYTAEEAGLAMGDQGGSGSSVRGLLKRARSKLVSRLEGDSR